MQCEGWKRYGGMFTLGRPQWVQCENEAVVMLKVEQEKIEDMPSCMDCWNEAIEKKIKIISVTPLKSKEE